MRRCAAVALAKIHVLDPSQDEDLIEILEKLLGDSSTMVLGSAVATLVEIDPTRFDIMHACFRKLCHLLADLDEWTQVRSICVCYARLRWRTIGLLWFRWPSLG